MDIVYLHGLRLETVIGLWDWERKIKQTLVVDLDLGTDTTKAAETDSVEFTVDYKTVCTRLIELADNSDFGLVEAFAESVATIMLTEFSIQWVRVRINKQGALREVRDVGVIIERGTRD